MNKIDIIAIAEGLKQIEDGVAQIQNVMREHKIKSLSEIATELILFFKKDDESLTESIIKRLE